ncbi:hypothetical protein DACRYDRAFT_21015 [Dacryopinax primogenitus]|uniref:Vacuolar sorting protein Vps3844 C-terminal domain-containing protein n=1 Tax=Dacryopinax primogenitus (strain DJM 731) TaxID=1858805 RepID=M5GDF3_DACPD|nr:uncharacterized protein DACRYDRAFT_21015 [Dacryopinax primogenitus]EJU04487.1 hypothetical protein DACRYDRAFT_21015 [Dacryopinax primogenitus]
MSNIAALSFLALTLLPTSLAASTSATVFLHPPPIGISYSPALSPTQGHAVLSYHLGIDRWVELRQSGEWIYQLLRYVGNDGVIVGAGEGGIAILVESDHPEEIMPSEKPAFTIPFSVSYDTYSSLFSTYDSRLSSLVSPSASFITTYNSSASSPSPLLSALDMADSPVEEGLRKITAYADWVDEGGVTGATIQVKGLGALRGSKQEAYDEAVRVFKAALSVPALANHNYAVVVLPTSAASLSPPAPVSQAATLNSSSCYATTQECDAGTSACSQHGHCVSTTRAGKTCYVCKCSKALALAGQHTNWAGAACEKIDISGSFALLVGSTIFLIAIAVGSVMLLYGVGEEILPSTLFGATPGAKRD